MLTERWAVEPLLEEPVGVTGDREVRADAGPARRTSEMRADVAVRYVEDIP